jgi:ribosomal protein L11 methyltransferase
MPSPTDPRKPEPRIPVAEDIRNGIRTYIGGRRRAPADILKRFARGSRLTRAMVRAAIRDLAAAGELAYTFEHGRTFLEPSFDRPVRVGERIVLCPPGKSFQPQAGDVVIQIMAGASFGSGRHPSTRLAVRGIEQALARREKPPGGTGSRVLDIGTGSGVLAIAALKLGVDSGIAIDIDPCALAEAKANLRLNGLDGRLAVSDAAARHIGGSFELITANLRLPTLLHLASSMATWTLPGAAVVTSGLRAGERGELLEAYERESLKLAWIGAEDEWLGLVFLKTGP